MNKNRKIIPAIITAISLLTSCASGGSGSSETTTTTKDYNEMIMDYFEDNSAPPAPKKKFETQVDSTNTFEYVDAKGFMDDYGRTYGDEGIVITKYIGKDTTVTVPAEIDGKKVAGDVFGAFAELYENEDGYQRWTSSIKELYFDEEYPEVVTFFGDNGGIFEALETVKLPRAQKNIQDGGFMRCSNLKSVELTSTLESIGHNSFEHCENLTEFEFGDSLESIGFEAFDSCYSLKSIDLPDSLESIGYSAFACCRSIKEVNIPEKFTIIPKRAFFACDALETVRLPEGVTEIESDAFSHCPHLRDIYIPDSVTKIDDMAFYKTKGVTFHCSPDSYAMRYAEKKGLFYSEE